MEGGEEGRTWMKGMRRVMLTRGVLVMASMGVI